MDRHVSVGLADSVNKKRESAHYYISFLLSNPVGTWDNDGLIQNNLFT